MASSFRPVALCSRLGVSFFWVAGPFSLSVLQPCWGARIGQAQVATDGPPGGLNLRLFRSLACWKLSARMPVSSSGGLQLGRGHPTSFRPTTRLSRGRNSGQHTQPQAAQTEARTPVAACPITLPAQVVPTHGNGPGALDRTGPRRWRPVLAADAGESGPSWVGHPTLRWPPFSLNQRQRQWPGAACSCLAGGANGRAATPRKGPSAASASFRETHPCPSGGSGGLRGGWPRPFNAMLERLSNSEAGAGHDAAASPRTSKTPLTACACGCSLLRPAGGCRKRDAARRKQTWMISTRITAQLPVVCGGSQQRAGPWRFLCHEVLP